MALVRLFLVMVALLGLLPQVVRADDDDTPKTDPNLDCRMVGMPIMAAEVSGARVECRLSGRSGTDTSFTVSAVLPSAPDVSVPVCAADLTDGGGSCLGAVIDRASSSLGGLNLMATLEPSGTTLGPITIGAPSTPPEAPMQFYPLGD